MKKREARGRSTHARRPPPTPLAAPTHHNPQRAAVQTKIRKQHTTKRLQTSRPTSRSSRRAPSCCSASRPTRPAQRLAVAAAAAVPRRLMRAARRRRSTTTAAAAAARCRRCRSSRAAALRERPAQLLLCFCCCALVGRLALRVRCRVGSAHHQHSHATPHTPPHHQHIITIPITINIIYHTSYIIYHHIQSSSCITAGSPSSSRSSPSSSRTCRRASRRSRRAPGRWPFLGEGLAGAEGAREGKGETGPARRRRRRPVLQRQQQRLPKHTTPCPLNTLSTTTTTSS